MALKGVVVLRPVSAQNDVSKEPEHDNHPKQDEDVEVHGPRVQLVEAEDSLSCPKADCVRLRVGAVLQHAASKLVLHESSKAIMDEADVFEPRKEHGDCVNTNEKAAKQPEEKHEGVRGV